MSLVGLSQGIPFFHAGVELLRSKSLDRNSYNSGDWFNKLDFTLHDNNWGVGLPPAGDNQGNWPIMAPLLANPALKPSLLDIQAAAAHFEEVLKIRKSSILFRLRTAKQIQDRVRFHNTGPAQVPGVIAMTVNDVDINSALDHHVRRLAVILNANAEPRQAQLTVFPCAGFRLHPVQAASADPVVRTSTYDPVTCTFTVPGRTAAVFWERRPVDEQLYLLNGVVADLVSDGTLNAGQGRSLQAKVENARRQIQRGKLKPAINMLEAFLHEVEALRTAGILSAEQAQALIADAEAALADLG